MRLDLKLQCIWHSIKSLRKHSSLHGTVVKRVGLPVHMLWVRIWWRNDFCFVFIFSSCVCVCMPVFCFVFLLFCLFFNYFFVYVCLLLQGVWFFQHFHSSRPTKYFGAGGLTPWPMYSFPNMMNNILADMTTISTKINILKVIFWGRGRWSPGGGLERSTPCRILN